MKPFSILLLLAAASPASAQGSTSQASSPAGGGTGALTTLGPYVRVQASSPGAAQGGNSHITGTSMAGQFVANSAGDTGVVSTGALDGVDGYSTGAGYTGVYGQNY